MSAECSIISLGFFAGCLQVPIAWLMESLLHIALKYKFQWCKKWVGRKESQKNFITNSDVILIFITNEALTISVITDFMYDDKVYSIVFAIRTFMLLLMDYCCHLRLVVTKYFLK